MSDHAAQPTSHGEMVPDAASFLMDRETWRRSLGDDVSLRQQAVDLQVAAERHRYTYTWSWMGVPVIRLPDDICTLQELFWEYRPERVVETGVARGGSMILNANLQRLCGLEPRVLGIDIAIFDHTHEALATHPWGAGIELVEADSTGREVADRVRDFLCSCDRALMVLDSNHTHGHVLAELRSLAGSVPVGGYVLVADTLIEEFPPGHFEGRDWDRGNNPLTAVEAFLAEDPRFERAREWCRRGLLSEFRDGVLRRTS